MLSRSSVRSARSPSISLISLGCSKNQVDSEILLSRFLNRGFTLTESPSDADLAIINTCGFIGPAKEESIETILDVVDIKRGRPGMRLMVSGCLYQRYPEIEEELKEVDYWLTEPGQLHSDETVVKVIRDLGPSRFRSPGEPEMYQRQVLLSEPGTAFVRISQGCDRTCSFCAIPKIKGGLRSRTIESILGEVRFLTMGRGVKEINLVAQDLTSLGTDLGRNTFLDLLEELDTVESVAWYRLHYAYPFGLTREMLEFLGQSRRFARYLDMPFQHGDDRMLKIMRRGGSRRGNLEYIEKVRSLIPGVALRTTILVGHPGETRERFENLLGFLDEAQFEWLGVFPFSPEEQTHSATLKGRPSKKVTDARVGEVLDTYRSARSLDAFGIGSVKDGLVIEESEDGKLLVRSQTEAADVDGIICCPRITGIRPGHMVKVKVLTDDELDFTGEIVSHG